MFCVPKRLGVTIVEMSDINSFFFSSSKRILEAMSFPKADGYNGQAVFT
jgi:hypothetical protein